MSSSWAYSCISPNKQTGQQWKNGLEQRKARNQTVTDGTGEGCEVTPSWPHCLPSGRRVSKGDQRCWLRVLFTESALHIGKIVCCSSFTTNGLIMKPLVDGSTQRCLKVGFGSSLTLDYYPLNINSFSWPKYKLTSCSVDSSPGLYLKIENSKYYSTSYTCNLSLIIHIYTFFNLATAVAL